MLVKRKNFKKLTKNAVACYKKWGECLSKEPWWNKTDSNWYGLLCIMEKEFGEKSYKKHLTAK